MTPSDETPPQQDDAVPPADEPARDATTGARHADPDDHGLPQPTVESDDAQPWRDAHVDPPEVPEPDPTLEHETHQGGMAALTLGALGIVFGDIGTSPLYALKQTFHGGHHLAPTHAGIFGVVSLIFWSIMAIVTLKYVLFIMRADNEGEGGIMALISLVRGTAVGARAMVVLVALGIFGASLFYADGMITPAISVLSAVEGIGLAAPALDHLIVEITIVIIAVLFATQRFGTAVVGRAFGPVMATWFVLLGLLGALQVAHEPTILRALSPTYAIGFLADRGVTAFLALGSVVLAVTGAEALYADMGHFGRAPIRRAWFGLVLPALALNYLGQGALLLRHPADAANPFYLLVPHWGRLPMVLLATLATVIASQAVISGAFSVTRQAVQLGFLPRLTIRHTSDHSIGQIYVPAVNWLLCIAVIGLVVGFGSSGALASAYGIAVTGTLAIDTILACVVVRMLWGRPLWMAVGAAVAFLVVDLGFFSANVPKVVTGGWFPLLVALGVFSVLMTWRRGRDVVSANRTEEEGSLPEFVLELDGSDDPPLRVRGTAVFLNASGETTPLALRYNVEHNHVLHEQVLVLTVVTESVPYVPDASRIDVDTVLVPDDGIDLVTVHFGFQEAPDIPRALRLAAAKGIVVDPDTASYFLSRITITPTRAPGMAMWRKRLFQALSVHAASPVAYFNLPEDRVVSLGSNIEL